VKTLWLKRDYREATRRLEGQFPDPSHVRQTLDEDTKVIVPDGRISAVLLCNVIPPACHKLAYELWRIVDELPSNRATAVGSRSLPRLKKNGTLGKRRGVPSNVLNVLARQDGNERLVKLVDELYKRYLPAFYAKQRAKVEKAPRWRLWNTVFSTIYVAKSFRTAYHRDSGNLKGAMTALMPMGKFTGGELILARWRVAIAYKPGDLLLFDPQQLHGNLPFKGDRVSAALYCEARIADCGE